MDTITNTVWQRKGSCIIFDQKSFIPFISNGSMVPLSLALTWSIDPPDNPGVSGHTILVSGLETIIETMTPLDAEDFLISHIRPLLIQLQNLWPDYGIVFGFTCHPKAFEETGKEEEVLFRRRDRQTVRLSVGLWDGSASVNMKRVVREGDRPGEEVIVGYYVESIS